MSIFRKLKHLTGRLGRDEAGAAALEFSLVATIFVITVMGVIELGRTYQVRNELAYAADIGGRKLTVLVNDPGVQAQNYAAQVKAEIASVFQGYDAEALKVTVTPEMVNGIQYQRLTLEYPMSVFIPYQSDTYQLKVTRLAVQL